MCSAGTEYMRRAVLYTVVHCRTVNTPTTVTTYTFYTEYTVAARPSEKLVSHAMRLRMSSSDDFSSRFCRTPKKKILRSEAVCV